MHRDPSDTACARGRRRPRAQRRARDRAGQRRRRARRGDRRSWAAARTSTSLHERAIIYAVGLLAVIAGWFLIHTMFIFRYAHLFYFDCDDDGSAQRGLIFPGTEEPDDYDFAYYSVRHRHDVSGLRRADHGPRRTPLTLVHALISFAYNTTILALVSQHRLRLISLIRPRAPRHVRLRPILIFERKDDCGRPRQRRAFG